MTRRPGGSEQVATARTEDRVAGRWGRTPSEDAAAPGAVVARWAAASTLVVTVAVAVGFAVDPDSITRTEANWASMRPGAATELMMIALVVLMASREGWSPRVRRLAGAAVAVPLLTVMTILGLRFLGLDGASSLFRGVRSWVPAEQTAAVHLLLGLAVFATPRRGRLLAALRGTGLVLGVLVPAVSLSAYAYGSGWYSPIPGLGPMAGLTAATTIGMAFGVAAASPDRWPVRSLIQGPSDRVLVERLLPFIVAMPIVGPILIASARFAGARAELIQIVGTLGPSLILVGLLGVALRDHRGLISELESRDHQLLSTLDGLPQAVFLRAQNGTLLHLNPEGQRFIERLGTSVEELSAGPGGLLRTAGVLDENGRALDPVDLPSSVVMRDGGRCGATLGFPLPDGQLAWFDVRAAPVPLTDGTTGVVATYDDVTERQVARGQLALAERSLRLTFDHAPIGVAVVAPHGELLRANAALRELLGHDEASMPAGGFWEVAHPDDREDDTRLVAACLTGALDRYRVERRYPHASGRWIWTQLSVALVRDDDGRPLHFIAQVVDLSERRSLEEELRAAAVEDPLTGLFNRRALTERLEEAQHRRARDGGDIGLLYLDLDRFKAINDRYGHDVGDRVLIEVAKRLSATTREIDTVARIGGDEFVVLCAPMAHADGLQELTARLATMPPVAVTVDAVVVEVGTSVGATLVEPSEGLDLALRRADAAMYRAKRRGRSHPPDAMLAPPWYPSERPAPRQVG